MKAIKNKWYSFYVRVLSIVLSLLGLQGCSELECMYGTPYVDVLYTGTVTDEDDKPLEGEDVIIKVTAVFGKDDVRYLPIDSTKTNAAGTYTYYENQVPDAKKVRVVAIDKDDPEIKDSVEVEPQKISEGRDSWHDGTYLVKADIKLKKKK